MQFVQMDVTPEIAQRWLSGGFRNRNVRERIVQNYAEDMAAGRWVLNGEAVKVTRNGRLIDGQHRMHAVIRANVSVRMWVCLDVPETSDVVLTLDAGISRRASDGLVLVDNVPNARNTAACLRRLQDFAHTGRFTHGSRYRFTQAEASRLHRLNPDVSELVPRYKHSKSLCALPQPTTLCAIYVLQHRVSPRLAEQVAAGLDSGANLHATHPVLALRNALLIRERLFESDVAELAIRAWNALCEGRDLKLLKVMRNDNFPQMSGLFEEHVKTFLRIPAASDASQTGTAS